MPQTEQLIQWLRSACARMADGLSAPDSPWERVPMHVPAGAFGPGSRWEFAHYFEGESSVSVTSIDDIVDWLGTCEYVSDPDQFNERDVWLQPCVFERLRRGDCEDFALWAWRKLAEMGVEAEFYVGRVTCGGGLESARQHAWVVYRVASDAFLFEPAACGRPHMIRPLPDVKDEYVPHFAVDRHFVSSAFVGCLLDAHHETTLGCLPRG